MPVHDWTRIDPGIFHSFQIGWVAAIHDVLNEGLLPEGCYALIEQHGGRRLTEILPLQAGSTPQSVGPAALVRRRSLAVRHISEHRLVALLEIVSPANKDRPRHVE